MSDKKTVSAAPEVQEKHSAPSGNSDEEAAEAAKPKSGFKTLLSVFSFGTSIDTTIQLVGTIAAVCAGAALPLMAIVLGNLITAFTDFQRHDGTLSPAEFRREIEHNTLWFVYLFIGKFALVYLHTLSFTLTADRMVKALRLECLSSILRQEVAEHEASSPGSLSSSITTHCNSIQTVVADRCGSTVQAVAMFVAAFVVAFYRQWKLTLAMAALVVATIVLIGLTAVLDGRIESRLLKTYSACTALAEEVFGSIKTVVAFGATEKFADRYNAILKEAEVDGRKKGPLMGLLFSSQYFFMFSGYALSFWFGLRLYQTGEIKDPGTIISVFFSMLMGLGALMALGPNMPDFVKAATAAEAVFAVLRRGRQNGSDDLEYTMPNPADCRGRVEMRNVSFSYPSRSDCKALSQVTLDCPVDSVTVIVGSSGAGKSTIVGLLERWFEPTEGATFLDGHDIRSLDPKWLRNQISLVQQEPELFNTTIFENVAYGLIGTQKENAPSEKKMELVKEACLRANAYGFIQSLSNGFETAVGERGALLSGGQKQRIAIARALVGNRPILLLDEATSALDQENASAIESFCYESSNRTTIIISHRLLAAERADKIIVLDEGTIVQEGTHEKLVQADGLYQRLYNSQRRINVKTGSTGSRLELQSVESIREIEQPGTTAAAEEEIVVTNARKRRFITCLCKIASEQRRHWLIFTVGFIACIVAGEVFPAQAILLSRLLEVFQKPLPEMMHDGNFWALMFFICGLIAMLSYALLGFFMTTLGTTLGRFYRYEYFRAMLGQDIAFFDRNAASTLAARLSQDPSSLHELISVKFGLLITVFVNLISSSIVALVFQWKLALVALFGALPFLFAAGYVRMKLDSALSETTIKTFEESARFASEAISAIRTVKALTLENTVHEVYKQHLARTLKKAYRQTFVIMIFFALSESLEFLASALAFWYGGRLLSTGECTAGEFFTVFIAIIIGGQAAGFLFGFSSSFNKANFAANHILNMREQVPQIESSTGQSIRPEEKNDVVIDFQNVSFAYPSQPQQPVLNGLTLQVKRGQSVGLVGSSGCGKTTVLALLERFYDIRSGRLLVFGQELSSVRVGEYRKIISLVSQEPTLYRGSIRDNVMFGAVDGHVSEERFSQACDDVNISVFVSSLPEGYDTDCGAKGIGLSGGQRQRVAIARALIRDPEILLLDEATSALDAETEELVRAALERAKAGRTIVIVAHRLSTIRNADVIFVMSDGRVVEQGTHEELLARQGHYFRMYQIGQGVE